MYTPRNEKKIFLELKHVSKSTVLIVFCLMFDNYFRKGFIKLVRMDGFSV